MAAIETGIEHLATYALATQRSIDLGAITVTTKRISSGRISVTVEGDLS